MTDVSPTEASAPSGGLERRRAFVLAAFASIAEHGVEGLRIRDVAKRAGANIATLYYYFPTKEGLIGGVVEYIVQQIVTVHASPLHSTTFTPRDALHQHFRDLQHQVQHTPELLRVMGELLLRAARDPLIWPILKRTDDEWQVYLEALLREGVQQEVFRPDIEVRNTAHLIMAFFKGVVMQLNYTGDDLAQAIAHLEASILPTPQTSQEAN